MPATPDKGRGKRIGLGEAEAMIVGTTKRREQALADPLLVRVMREHGLTVVPPLWRPVRAPARSSIARRARAGSA